MKDNQLHRNQHKQYERSNTRLHAIPKKPLEYYAINVPVSRKMEELKDDILIKIAYHTGDDVENYSHGGNQVFYKEERIREITFDFPDGHIKTNSIVIEGTFVPVATPS